jgi:hypothetical protein
MIQSPTWKQAGSGRGGDDPENSGRAAKGARRAAMTTLDHRVREEISTRSLRVVRQCGRGGDSLVRSPRNPTPDHAQNLYGVAAPTARRAWAAGYAVGGGEALIVHWNGSAWK